MRKTLAFCAVLFLAFMVGCSGVQINDNAQTEAIAYASGKAMGIAITKIYPAVNDDLAVIWDRMMANEAPDDIMQADVILQFYSDAMGIIALHTGDEYGLIQDLSVLLMIFGAEFDADGELTFIQPVPVSVLRFFEMGYDSGIMVASRERDLR